jgi:hypothetical protein
MENSLLYGFTTKNFAVNGILYSMVFTPSLYREDDGPAETFSFHVIIVNNMGRSMHFDFGGNPATNIDEQLLPAGVVVEMIKAYREFWKGEDYGLGFHKPLTDELLEYLTGKGVTHFRIDDLLNESVDQLNPKIDEFLFEAHAIKDESSLNDEFIKIDSERFRNMVTAEKARFYVSISADTYIDFHETCEKNIVVT